MSPAVATIPDPADGEERPTCNSCVGKLADIALRCSGCKTYIHLRCSGMPENQLVRLSLSQASCVCTTCVKTKDAGNDDEKYDAECTKMREVIAKEISIIDQAEKSEDKSVEEVIVADDVQVVPATKSTKSPKVCHYFINRNCRFGPKG